MPKDADLTYNGTTTDKALIGIATNGVILFSGVSAKDVDPLYPAVYKNVKTVADGEE